MTYRDKTEADQARIAALEQLLAQKEAALVEAKGSAAVADFSDELLRKQRRSQIGSALVGIAIFAMMVAVIAGAWMGFSGRAEAMLVLVSIPCVALLVLGTVMVVMSLLVVAPLGQVLAITTPRGIRVHQGGQTTVCFPGMSAQYLSIRPRAVELSLVVTLSDQQPLSVRLVLAIAPENTTDGITRYLARWGSKNADEMMIAFVKQKAEVLLQDLAASSKRDDWTRSREELQDKFESLFKEPAEHAAIVLEDCTLSALAPAER